VKLTPSVAQRGIAAVAVLLLAALVGLAIASRFRDSSSEPTLPARVGNWYQARAAPLRADLEGTTTACGVQLEQQTMGIADPVLPCGAKIYIGYGDEDVLTQVIGTGPGPAGTRFGLTPALAQSLGIERPVTVRWSYAR
jgi:peptidoglycan lytic transglycosylase